MDKFTAAMMQVLAEKQKKKEKIVDPRRVAVKPPDSRVPKGLSLVSFDYLLKNAIKYQPDEANSEHVELSSITKKTFKNGAKGVICNTITDLPQYKKVHRWQQVIRCTPTDYSGKIVNCPSVVVNCSCLVGDTKVLTDKGWKTMYEIAEPISDNLPINYIIDGKNYAGSAPFYTGNKKVWEVKFDNGNNLVATPDHRVRVLSKTRYKNICIDGRYSGNKRIDEFVWKEIRDLSLKDRVVVNEYTPKKIEKTKEFQQAYFVGVMMGDGSMFNTGFPNLVLNCTDKSVSILPRLEKIGVVKSVKDKSGNGHIKTRLNLNHRATEILDRYHYINKQSVSIDSYESFMGYLSGLIDTDGNVNERIYIYGDVTYLRFVFEELLRYGYGHCRLVKKSSKGQKTNMGVRSKDLWAIEIGMASVRQMYPNLTLRKEHKRKLAKLLARTENFKIATTKAISIDKNKGSQPVYDITVPKKSRFIANGLMVHNCPRFLFVWNWVLWTKHASVLNATNEPPNQTNPRRLIGGCKHTIIALQAVKKRGW